jgi:hypothetical protein
MSEQMKRAKELFNKVIILEEELSELNTKAMECFSRAREESKKIFALATERDQTPEELEADLQDYMEEHNETFIIGDTHYTYNELFDNATNDDDTSDNGGNENLN